MPNIILTSIDMDELLRKIRLIIKEEMSGKIRTDFKEDLIKTDEAMQMFKVSKVTLYKWRKSGKLKAYKIGQGLYYKKSDIEASLNQVDIPAVNNAPFRDMRIKDLVDQDTIPVTIANCIYHNTERLGIKYKDFRISDFSKFTEDEIMRMPKIGRVTLRVIKGLMKQAGVQFK